MELDELFPFVAPEAKACPEQTMRHHIRQALIRFCDQSLAWQANLTPITTTAIADEYAMPFPAEAALVKILEAGLDDEPLDVSANGTAPGRKGYVWTEDLAAIIIAPQPQAGRKLKLMVALRPTQAAAGISSMLFERYAAVIAKGALSTLMDMANVSWSDPMKAAIKKTEFDNECAGVAARVSKGYGRSARRVRPFYF